MSTLEDVLELYAEPHAPQRPVVCFDEVPIHLIANTRCPLPAKPGQPERYNYDYQRNGTCNQFVFVETGVGWQRAANTDPCTQLDFDAGGQVLVSAVAVDHGRDSLEQEL